MIEVVTMFQDVGYYAVLGGGLFLLFMLMVGGCSAQWMGAKYDEGKEKYVEYRKEGQKLIGRYEALRGVYLEVRSQYLAQREEIATKCDNGEITQIVCDKLADFDEKAQQIDANLKRFNNQAERVIKLAEQADSKLETIDDLKIQAEETYADTIDTIKDLAQIGATLATAV